MALDRSQSGHTVTLILPCPEHLFGGIVLRGLNPVVQHRRADSYFIGIEQDAVVSSWVETRFGEQRASVLFKYSQFYICCFWQVETNHRLVQEGVRLVLVQLKAHIGDRFAAVHAGESKGYIGLFFLQVVSCLLYTSDAADE